ncbi:PTS sugar transporter subunit IIB [Georgenia sp. TF02-10]|uniref:PTS sugar transporter subunit IIB n=1 Tax=Georgenia sp. TF02-10 TaxID=2917725 RepID=UPI001FA7A401|nr:PTS sugar transporter subunit IIB [Georgenia sp. TF02-10]UNX54616.1 PTS sugar transporter subunit IIB [Georgenia sp. TF02-10]
MKIITTCGMGFGTSLMLLMDIQEIGRKHGVDVQGEALDMSSVKGRDCDAIFGSSEIVKELSDIDVPVIGISNILDKAEIEAKFLDFIKQSDVK